MRVELKTRNENTRNYHMNAEMPTRTQSFVLGKTKLPPAYNSISKRKATLSLLDNFKNDKQEAFNGGRTMSVKPELKPELASMKQTLTDYSKARNNPLY